MRCWSRCSRPTRAASTTRAAAPAACSCSREKFIEAHGGKLGDISIYGQESNYTTWRLAKMNLAIRGIEAESAPARRHLPPRPPPRPQGRLRPRQPAVQRQRLARRQADDDKRWEYGMPPEGNANYAWVQHFIHHLAPTGIAGFVLANGSMSSNQSGEGEIRKAIIEADLVDCMVALPGQLFYSRRSPSASGSSRARPRTNGNASATARRDALHRRPQARHAGRPRPPRADRRRHRRRSPAPTTPGAATSGRRGKCIRRRPRLLQIRHARRDAAHGHVLTPGRYVGAEAAEDDGEPFEEKMPRLVAELHAQFAESAKLEQAIKANLRGSDMAGEWTTIALGELTKSARGPDARRAESSIGHRIHLASCVVFGQTF